jgi:hypothetical protein
MGGVKDDIWIVTTGEYSSYSVTAAFTEVEVADEFARISNANTDGWPSEYRVERIDLNPPMPVLKQRPVVTPLPDDDYDPVTSTATKMEERDAIIESIDWGCVVGRDQ